MKVFTLHGFMGTPHDFSFLSKISSGKEYIHLTLAGHGDKALHSNTWQENAEYMSHEILQSAEQEDFVLLGYSMGGRVFLAVADILFKKGTPNFKGLILESAHTGLASDDERIERFESDHKLFKNVKSEQDLEQFLRQWWSAPLFGGLQFHEDFPTLIDHKKKGDYKKWKKALRLLSVANQPNYNSLLARKDFVPTLSLAGSKDQKFFELTQRLEQYEKVESAYFNCGHNIHFARPYEFFQVVDQWMAKL